MGGELNAATSRETTVVYTRVPDAHVERALDAMADMVFAPAFDDVDSEREVVLEEIAMVDDNPQDLVHDLAAEAVFGTHPLGRPVIGRAEVIASVSPRALRAYHDGAYVGTNVVLAASGNIRHDRLVELFAARRAGFERDVTRPPAVARASPASGLPIPPQAHRAVPRRARRAGHRTGRRAPVRRRAARRDPRRLGVVAPLPGDPGEARDGLQRLQLRLAVRGDGPGRDLRRDAGGQPRPSASPSPRRSCTTSPRGTCARASSTGRRRTSRGACCSRSRARRTG